LIYAVFIFILFSTSLAEFSQSKENRFFVYLFSCFIIICLSGLRWNTGTDWLSYYEFFENEENYHLFEPGYVLINHLFKQIIDNYSFFLLGTSTLILFLFGKAIFNMSPYPIFSMFLLISLVLPFWVRQSFSLAVLFLGFYFLSQNSKKKYLFLVLIASTFHYSALIALPFVFFYNSKLSSKVIIISLIVAYSNSQLNLLSNLVDYFLQIIGMDGIVGAAKLANYLETETINENIDYGFRNLVSVLNIISYIALFHFFKKKIKFGYETYNIMFNAYFFGSVINLMSMGDIEVFRRFSMFFSLAPVILFPILIFNIHDKYLKIIFITLVSLISFGRYYGNLSSYWSEYYPYISIFNKVERR
jgi:hypothetical protein